MFKKKERLKRVEFSRFFSLGTKYHSPIATLVYTKNEIFHAAVVVSKKVSKSAVKRNKIRRRVYNVIRNTNKTGVFIFILKPKSIELSFEELKKSIVELINKVEGTTYRKIQ